MAKALKNRIDEFKKDRDLLPFDDNVIADAIGENKGNYSSYMTGRRPITNKFLDKFYKRYDEEIKKIKEKAKEEDPQYVKLSLQNDILELNQKYNILANNFTELANQYKLLTDRTLQLEESIDLLNQHLATLHAQEEKITRLENMVSLLTKRLLNRKTHPKPKTAKKKGKKPNPNK